jgi:hypothetical protein
MIDRHTADARVAEDWIDELMQQCRRGRAA